MKIVQVINSLVPGGAERLAQDLHERFLQMGHQSGLVALAGDELVENRDGFWCTGCRSPYAATATRALTSFFRHAPLCDAGIVHVHLFPSLLRVPPALKRAGWSGGLVSSEHSTSNRRRGSLIGRILDRFTYRRYDRIVCVSEAVREELVAWKPGLRGKAAVIPNGVRLERFLSPSPRMEFHDPPVILSVGRLTPAKNYLTALKAIAELADRTDLDFTYRIAGDGTLRKKLEVLVGELSLTDRVRFLGAVEDTAPLLREADIFFIPSLLEGFGIAAVEAMAAGIPVVAADVPGLRDVAGTDTGALVDPGSPGQMSDALESLLREPERAFRAGSRGPVQASPYSLEACAVKHLELYGSTLM